MKNSLEEFCLKMRSERFTMATIALFFLLLPSSIMQLSMYDSAALHIAFWILTEVATALFSCYMAGATWNCCRLGASSVYTIKPCTRLQCHFTGSHICRMHVCLDVTCHMYLWLNDWDLLRVFALTLGWNGYENKSQHGKLTLENIIVLPPLLLGLEPETIR